MKGLMCNPETGHEAKMERQCVSLGSMEEWWVLHRHFLHRGTMSYIVQNWDNTWGNIRDSIWCNIGRSHRSHPFLSRGRKRISSQPGMQNLPGNNCCSMQKLELKSIILYKGNWEVSSSTLFLTTTLIMPKSVPEDVKPSNKRDIFSLRQSLPSLPYIGRSG